MLNIYIGVQYVTIKYIVCSIRVYVVWLIIGVTDYINLGKSSEKQKIPLFRNNSKIGSKNC